MLYLVANLLLKLLALLSQQFVLQLLPLKFLHHLTVLRLHSTQLTILGLNEIRLLFVAGLLERVVNILLPELFRK